MSELVQTVSAPLDRLDERYGHLRIAQPQREVVIEQSLRRVGQLTPLVVVAREKKLAVVDGFKRLHAAQTLSLEALEARVLTLTEQASVALIYGLNRDGRGMSDFEQALVVRTLCRDHGLAQVEVVCCDTLESSSLLTGVCQHSASSPQACREDLLFFRDEVLECGEPFVAFSRHARGLLGVHDIMPGVWVASDRLDLRCGLIECRLSALKPQVAATLSGALDVRKLL